MLFNSIAFIIFLPVVFVLYWLTSKNRKLQNILITIASYYFYGCWSWKFISLLFFTTVLGYYSGLLLEKNTKKLTRKWICGLNITINLAILAYYKYYNFFADSLQDILLNFGYQIDSLTLQIVLPVGISFYTFQALSYTIDVYRKQIRATIDFFAFASFIAFFPQLVAGPIEQANNLLPQFLNSRHFDYATAVSGMRQILWGFFKKLVIADNCSKLANGVFDHYFSANGSMLVLGIIFFSFQIYGDFSGYSDIAIGTGKLFGIELRKNFNLPYFSRNITEFWRRWHISLNKWFIQYVYIPLGGNRLGKGYQIRNILIVFIFSGLWHGANWTFVIWGLYNGLLLSIMVFIKYNSHKTPEYQIMSRIRNSIQMVITFIFVGFGWILFRSATLSDAIHYYILLFSQNPFVAPNYYNCGGLEAFQIGFTLFFVFVLQIVEWSQRKQDYGLDLSNVSSKILRWSIYILLLMIFAIFAGSQTEFIYFQF